MTDPANVHYADLWGLRDEKYSALREAAIPATDWELLQPRPPHFFFVPKDFSLQEEYSRSMSVADAFGVRGKGMATRRDYLCVDFDKADLLARFGSIASDPSEQSLRDRYNIVDTPYWGFHEARREIADSPVDGAVHPYFYRPFDVRHVYYNPRIIERGDSRWALMRHLLRPNRCLIVPNKVMLREFRHAWVANGLVDYHILETAHANSFVFPIYAYTENTEPGVSLFSGQPAIAEPNLSRELTAAVADRLVLRFVPDGRGDLESTFGPEDVFHYMYAVFHCPTYRERYAEFLKIDFPRLPLTSDLGLFRALAGKGEELVALHLMESPTLDHPIAKFPIKGSNEVEKVRYAEPAEGRPGRVYINKAQYFQGVEPEVWEFHIGGYQVLEKWLKDRKGRTLSYDDVTHYGKIVVALKETIRLMQEIDELIPSWPIE